MKREVLNYLVRAFEARMQSERISELKFDFPDCWQEIIASGNYSAPSKGVLL